MRPAILALVVPLVGCTSEYMPRTPHHVAVTMQNGKPVYVRDGRTFEPGLGGGLVDAVQGNPAAVAAAEEFHSRQITGLASTLLGTAGFIGGMAWGTVLAASDANRPGSQFAVPVTLMVAGVVAMIVGTCYLATAAPYQWDAINIFNDGATPSFAPPGPPGPPGYTSANESLQMRDR
ncbi:MAG TPA: hypothetical protein VGG74_23925 [Kofleriaceae bacterium]|jgi:hypothetical protein